MKDKISEIVWRFFRGYEEAKAVEELTALFEAEHKKQLAELLKQIKAKTFIKKAEDGENTATFECNYFNHIKRLFINAGMEEK